MISSNVEQYFGYSHLKPELQAVSKPFHDLAVQLCSMSGLAQHEREVSLRHLFDAKNSAVLAAVLI